MRTPQLPYEVMPANQIWGLGVRVITHESYGRLAVGSFGWSGAYGSHFWIDPENKVIGIYMKNSNYDGGSGTYTGAMFEHIVTESLNK
jgi:CubicO group peptidase (beta-lactamase class C family)